MRKFFLGALAWAMAVYIAYIYLWYLQYKFTGDQGSVWLFTVLTDWLGVHGHEKFMRIATGSTELTASFLLLIPATQAIGGLLSLGIISGAIFFHVVSPLGIDPYQDGATLFKEACAVWVASVGIILIRRQRLIALLDRYIPFLPVPARLRTL
jgi:hypothetical protein